MGIDFDKVQVGKDERVKLEKRLAQWAEFHASTVVDPPDSEEFLKLLKVEVTGRKRLYLATRLLGMYHRACRSEDAKLLAKVISSK